MSVATGDPTTHGRWSSLAIALVLWTAFNQPATAADLEPVPCLMTTRFEEMRDHFINVKGRVAAAPVTTFLPADSNSRLVFQEPIGDSQNTKIFRVFETDSADIKS